jgi:hypothetical protein
LASTLTKAGSGFGIGIASGQGSDTDSFDRDTGADIGNVIGCGYGIDIASVNDFIDTDSAKDSGIAHGIYIDYTGTGEVVEAVAVVEALAGTSSY